jgi:transposase
MHISPQEYRSSILAWYESLRSTAPLEGVNNKIKTLKRTAYDYSQFSNRCIVSPIRSS